MKIGCIEHFDLTIIEGHGQFAVKQIFGMFSEQLVTPARHDRGFGAIARGNEVEIRRIGDQARRDTSIVANLLQEHT